MLKEKNYDIIVIGGGPAGYSAAIRGAQLGAKVLLIEKDRLGGTCLNRGCVPTKFLWEAVHRIEEVRKSDRFGFTADVQVGSFASIQQKNRKNVEILTRGIKALLESYKIENVTGAAKFLSINKIGITSAGGEKDEVIISKLIIASGSAPKELPVLKADHNKVLDSTDALMLDEAPKTLLIVGGGAIGIEMATIFEAFGSEVTIIEKEESILPGEDRELQDEVKKNLMRAGVTVNTGSAFSDDLRGKFEKILLVAGRKLNVDGLNLESAGIEFTKNGITVNEYLETSVSGIFAAGDVNGNAYFAYTAQSDGLIAADNAYGKKRKAEYSAVPRVVFSDPVSASVGKIPPNLSADRIAVGKFPFSASARAYIEGERSGWVKVSVNKDSGEILSAQIIGARADDLIQLFSMAVANKLKIEDFRRELFFHPGFSEAVFNALEDSLKKCVELPKKQ